MTSNKQEEKIRTYGTLCDATEVEEPMSSSEVKDEVCAIVEEMTSGVGREVHAKLHAMYKKFARSTPAESKLTENNKLEVFNQVRARVLQIVQGTMEALSFGPLEAEAVAKLISAGAASEKVGYTKSPAGVNMSNLLSSAKEALTDRQAGPKERTVNTKNRTSTEFWSA
ncbi:hypothetical protein EBZ37_11565, partial [bacterium]|nr:hypothetical protein [bacterium]